jgi:predicted RNase H-like nuclease (RuvC/YqgF family)
MSPIGKVFLVLNLALAGLFVGSAASLVGASESYRVQAEDIQVQLTTAQADASTEASELRAQLTNAEGAKDRLAASKAQVESDRDALSEELKTEQTQNSDLRERLSGSEGKLGDLESTNRSNSARIVEISTESRNLRNERDDAIDSRDSALKSKASAERGNDKAQRQANELSIALGREKDRANSAEAKLSEVAKLYKVDLNTLNAQPDLAGVVLDASYDGTPVVVINMGSQDQVKPGFTFDVYNGATYKGRIYVETVNTHQAAATVQMVGNAPIAAGDAVVTRL